MKKKILIALSIIVCIIAIGVFVLAGRGFSASTGLFLGTDNGDMIILDNSPIVMSARSGNDDMFAEYESGDKIFVIHDGIMETYPAKTGVYFSIKLADGHISHISETVLRQLCELGWIFQPVLLEEGNSEAVSDTLMLTVSEGLFNPDLFDTSYYTSYVTYDIEKIKSSCYNSDRMIPDDNTHLPLFRFDTHEELRAFMDSFDNIFGSGENHPVKFNERLKEYNEDFFKNKSLFVVYFGPRVSDSGYILYGVYTDGEILRLEYKYVQSAGTQVDLCTDSNRMSIVGIEKDFLGNCSTFDAVLVE